MEPPCPLRVRQDFLLAAYLSGAVPTDMPDDDRPFYLDFVTGMDIAAMYLLFPELIRDF